MGELSQPQTLGSLVITNQCIVICDLSLWSGPDSRAWTVLRGTQDEIGGVVAGLVRDHGVDRLEDFGGVSQAFLCDRNGYLDKPPHIKGAVGIFSFTPKNRLTAEGLDLARVAALAGYRLLILTAQKRKKYGKVWTLEGLLRHLDDDRTIDYYEDTNTVIDDLKASKQGHRVHAVHVQAAGFEEYVSNAADAVISQQGYLTKVPEDNV